MAKLPNADKAIIEEKKVRDYLLSPTHPRGRFKAELLGGLGYSAETCEMLKQDLRDLILRNEATPTRKSRYGQKFNVEGPLRGPNGRTVQVVTAWIVLQGETIPRLVTLHRGS